MVEPQLNVDAESAEIASPDFIMGTYWMGLYRKPENREEWAWVLYDLFEDIAKTRRATVLLLGPWRTR